MLSLMIRTSLAGAALFAGALLAHAQSAPPPAEAAPIPDDQGGYAVPAPPAVPAVPAPDDDSDEG